VKTGRSGEDAVRIGVLSAPAGLAVYFVPLEWRAADEAKPRHKK
jgi:hypothetical protein